MVDLANTGEEEEDIESKLDKEDFDIDYIITIVP
jgi:hypothetical protein